jgi:hypothetical protein
LTPLDTVGSLWRMADVISTVSGGLAIGQSVLQFLGYIRGVKDAKVISALFDPDPNLKYGDEKIHVLRHNQEDDRVWCYEVEDLEDYTFVRFPVIGSGIAEVTGALAGARNPEARLWRWVSMGLPGRIYGGDDSPNVEVDFVVVGYRPKAVVQHFSPR